MHQVAGVLYLLPCVLTVTVIVKENVEHTHLSMWRAFRFDQSVGCVSRLILQTPDHNRGAAVNSLEVFVAH
jgi:hypothetical protein